MLSCLRVRSLVCSSFVAVAAMSGCEGTDAPAPPDGGPASDATSADVGPGADAGPVADVALDSAGPDANDAAPLDDGHDDAGQGCAEPTAPAIEHNRNITIDETWAAGLHDVTFDVGIRSNATLTISPCAILRIVPDRGIYVGSSNVGDGGKIVARGTAERPIVIQDTTGARWNDLLVNSQGQVDLAYVTFKNGGGRSARAGGSLHLYGDQYQPIQQLAKVDHVTILDSGKYGVVLEGRAAFADGSRDLTIARAGDTAMRVNAPAMGTIPSGTYTGNGVDAIRIMGSGGYDLVDADVTLHDRGVPYVVGGDGAFHEMSVQGADGTAPLLTIEAGVVLKFGKVSSGFYIERASTTNPARGALRVLGTFAKPVIFTSNEPAPAAGDWTGIHLRGVPDPRNKIDYAIIEYAGGDTGTRGFSCGTPVSPDPISNEAALAIFGQPASAFVTNTVIAKSAANGIERAWTGRPVDFEPTNTFSDVKWCKQTYPRPEMGICPDPPPCPQ
jgi:hypothetical protein